MRRVPWHAADSILGLTQAELVEAGFDKLSLRKTASFA